MNSPIARRIIACAVLSLTAAGCRGEEEAVYIGIAGPLEAANGISMRRAAELAAEELNAGGDIRGRRIVLRMENDSASPATALRVAERLRADDDIVAVVGHVNSAASITAAQAYNAPSGGEYAGRPVVQISPASSAPALSGAGEWTFRITPTDLEFSPRLADWAARELGSRRAVVLYANDEYGQGVRNTFVDEYQRLGGTVLSADPYLPRMFESGTELDPYLVRAFGRGADAVVVGGQADAGLKIIRASRRLGYTGPILGADGLTNVKDGGPIAEGVYVSSAFLPDRDAREARAFVDAYRARYGGDLPDHRGAMTYDIVRMLARAIREVGTDRRAIRDYVAQIGRGRPSFVGASGEVKFDENGDVVGKDVTVGVVRGGELVTARPR
jgi:branched-chain amino acid transport system substrate-binding protein